MLPLIIVSVQGYLVFIDRIHLMLDILKQHLLSIYRFTIKQAGLVVIKRKTFRNHTPVLGFSSTFLFFTFLYAYTLALKATNSVMIFPPSSSFVKPITFLFFPMGTGLLSSFRIEPFLHIFCDIPVKFFGLYLLNKAVSIHIVQLKFAAILWSHVVVMKLIH